MTASTILVVDDDPDIRDLFALQLRAAGYEVVTSADGISGLSIARQRQPDLILLDVGLPGGDGLTVLERMKGLSSLQDIPVIVVTGEQSDACRDAALGGGAAEFLNKPLNPEDVLAAVHRVLGDSAAEEAGPCPHCGHSTTAAATLDSAMVEEIAQATARAAVREFAATFRRKATAST